MFMCALLLCEVERLTRVITGGRRSEAIGSNEGLVRSPWK
jgi:hypothetical protein